MNGLPSPGLPPGFTHSRDSSYSFNQMNDLGSQNKAIYSPEPNADDTEKPKSGLSRSLSLGVRSGPGHAARRRAAAAGEAIPESDADAEDSSDEDISHAVYGDDEEYTLTPAQVEAERRAQASQRERGGGLASPTRRIHAPSIRPAS
ncbi:hypothetical protein N7460_003776 [Penicillium canescens]|uniref:Uncharacterized protein n=1 Tax=Penicillium canescens TaxID=5083 RepID=A0AAD6NB61_PENCN|nr:hypothetical protein N7460_003776 [Penicillium canescens]